MFPKLKLSALLGGLRRLSIDPRLTDNPRRLIAEGLCGKILKMR